MSSASSCTLSHLPAYPSATFDEKKGPATCFLTMASWVCRIVTHINSRCLKFSKSDVLYRSRRTEAACVQINLHSNFCKTLISENPVVLVTVWACLISSRLKIGARKQRYAKTSRCPIMLTEWLCPLNSFNSVPCVSNLRTQSLTEEVDLGTELHKKAGREQSYATASQGTPGAYISWKRHKSLPRHVSGTVTMAEPWPWAGIL